MKYLLFSLPTYLQFITTYPVYYILSRLHTYYLLPICTYPTYYILLSLIN
jgi:hypothetical protein